MRARFVSIVTALCLAATAGALLRPEPAPRAPEAAAPADDEPGREPMSAGPDSGGSVTDSPESTQPATPTNQRALPSLRDPSPDDAQTPRRAGEPAEQPQATDQPEPPQPPEPTEPSDSPAPSNEPPSPQPPSPQPPSSEPPSGPDQVLDGLAALAAEAIADARRAADDAAATPAPDVEVPQPAPLPSPAPPSAPDVPEPPEAPEAPEAPETPEAPEPPGVPATPGPGAPSLEQIEPYLASLMRDGMRLAAGLVADVEEAAGNLPTVEPTVEPTSAPTVEPTPPPAPSSAAWSPLETITVDSRAPGGAMSATTLEPQRTYWLEASGVYQYQDGFFAGGDPMLADAECSSSYAGWKDEHWIFGGQEFELVAWNGPEPTEEEWWEIWMGERPWPVPVVEDWAPAHAHDTDSACSRTHVYTATVQGAGEPLRFQIQDYYHANNRGELTVRIFDEAPAAAPEAEPLPLVPSETPRPWMSATPSATPTPTGPADTPAGPAPFTDPAWILWAYGEGATSSSTVDARDPDGWTTRVLERNRKYHIEVAGTFSYNGTALSGSSLVAPGTGHADAACALDGAAWSSGTAAPRLEVLVNGIPAGVSWRPQYWSAPDRGCSRTHTYVLEMKAPKDVDARFTFRIADDSYGDNAGELNVTMILIRG